MNEKTQFTPEDVGRTFETATPGVTAKLVDHTESIDTYLFKYSDGHKCWCYANGKANVGLGYLTVFPSRPVEEAPQQPTIDTEVEELARELFIHTDGRMIKDCFEVAEKFINFRNERRASHGK